MKVGYIKYKPLLLVGINIFLLTACVSESKRDLELWVQEEDKRYAKSEFPKLGGAVVNPEKFVPVAVDPFQASRIGVFLGKSDDNPDYTRSLHLPPLKDVSLQDIKLIGLIINKNLRMAVIQHGPNLFRVGIGTKIGTNGGVVTSINGSGINIKQRIDDGTGKIVDKVSFISFS
ncbi:pilus assembly protein PilP [Candidatus Ichthyocystis hellenicum]|uniref:pilus assembly protein PilP n=1 Tax=Candidatus Ichthyocystis hellenicum TaxID=1561003 RepID=UPI000B8104D1|nr:pilus assembly protein PilP [Candidatus Ichthyocystis hellenicum]